MQGLRPLKSKSRSLPVGENLQRTQPVFGLERESVVLYRFPRRQGEMGGGDFVIPMPGGLQNKAESCVMKDCPKRKGQQHLY